MAKRKTKDTRKFNLIKEVLESQGKTQTWLAEALDRDFVTVTRYVNNKRQPTLETLFEIARILKISPRELING
jgi:putative transcriptional regulator